MMINTRGARVRFELQGMMRRFVGCTIQLNVMQCSQSVVQVQSANALSEKKNCFPTLSCPKSQHRRMFGSSGWSRLIFRITRW